MPSPPCWVRCRLPEREPHRHPTIVDVARLAEVAPSTVSRVLNGHPRISEETKRRVRAAARTLHYRPNTLARSLRTQSTPFVGIVVPDITVAFYARFVKAAQDVLEPEGLQVLVISTERDGQRETAGLRTLVEHRVAGLLLATSGGAVREPAIPTVFFDALVPGRGVAQIAAANADGIDALVGHLVEHGHTRIAYIGGPPELTSGTERLDGFRAALRRRGLPLREEWIGLGDLTWSPASGAAAMASLLALREPPTALVAAGDTLALGAMRICREAGLRLPQDLALVCFDDPVFGELLDPPLTALVRTDAAMGTLAARLLLGSVDGRMPAAPLSVRLPVELVVRRSCGCA